MWLLVRLQNVSNNSNFDNLCFYFTIVMPDNSKCPKDVTYDLLVRNFYRGSLKFILNENDVNIMNLEWQQKFLDTTFHSKLLIKYPLNNEFKRLFLKKIITELERNQEVHDDLYIELCKAMHNKSYDNGGFSYRHYFICDALENIITIKETNNMVINGTTGMRTWEAAFLLSDWALSNKEMLSNKNILELGSGVGFTGITVAKMCKTHSYLLSDCHHEVLKTICENIEINFPTHIKEQSSHATYYKDGQSTLGVMMLDWNEVENFPTDIVVPDIIIGADIVYDPSIIKCLCSVIDKFCNRNKNLEVYLANVIRNEETFGLLLSELDSYMLLYEKKELPRSTFIEWDGNMHTCLLKITSK